MIIQDAEGVTIPTDARTIAGAELVIVAAPNGMYQIKSLGEGNPPKITQEYFTNLVHAKRALAAFQMEVLPTITKKKVMKEAMERRQRAAELKNGALDRNIQDED